MVIFSGGTQIFYKRNTACPSEMYANGKQSICQTVILLHGWGASHKLMDKVFDCLSDCGCDVINVDLPGFGDSPEPPAYFGIEDYAGCIRDLLAQLDLQNVTVVGHSFGGRIALLLGIYPRIKALVLTGCAGIKPRFSLKKWLAVQRYKRAKSKGKDLSGFGSADYRAASEVMRRILVRVVLRHLDGEVKKIKVPILLIWGKDDKDTPLYMARRIKKRASDCGLVVMDGGHFAYLENSAYFCAVVKAFVLGQRQP